MRVIAKSFAGIALLVVALTLGGCNPFASKGTMPPPGANGVVDASLAPDFIAVAGRDDGIAGYVPKRYLFPQPGLPLESDIPVYAADLQTLVGHMVVGKGFVPVSVDPATIPNFPVQVAPSMAQPPGAAGKLTVYVRSAVVQTTWLVVRTGGGMIGATGYNIGLGVGCDDIPIGGELVLMDRDPQDAGARVLRSIYTRGEANFPATLWVDVGADGAVHQGSGVPDWWSGPPQAC